MAALLVAGERPQTRVPLGLRPAKPARQSGQDDGLEIDDDRDEGDSRQHESTAADERPGAAPSASATERSLHELGGGDQPDERPDGPGDDVAPAARLPLVEPEADSRS